ncbi:fasciclin domain-containing protein [Maribacter sp.]
MHYKAVPLSLMLLLFTYLSFAQSPIQSSESMPSLMRMDPEKSILKNTESSKNHQMLLAVMRASDLEEILGQSGPFTVFAPSDTAFEKLSKAKIDALLLPENKKELQSLMRYHIIAGNFSASKILKAMCRGAGKASFTTVQGDEITASMQGLDIILTDNLGNTARITTADYNQCNGVIHEIDSVIRPSKI